MMTKPHEVPFRVHDSDNNNGVRRMSKPMMEKRRRARINNSLMQLKAIVVDSGKLNIQVVFNYTNVLILKFSINFIKTSSNFL
jgi:hypothetical protein